MDGSRLRLERGFGFGIWFAVYGLRIGEAALDVRVREKADDPIACQAVAGSVCEG